ncbi:MAG: hypothetical protein QGI75_00090 [Phycisphaerales bacterium]|jgi:hypothetical protein|nr:hypothetical protein [Phycisphaerales bacterium]
MRLVTSRIIFKRWMLACGDDRANEHTGPYNGESRDQYGENRQFLRRHPSRLTYNFTDDDHEGYHGEFEDSHAWNSERINDHLRDRIHLGTAEEQNDPRQDDVEGGKEDEPEIEVWEQHDGAVDSPGFRLRELFGCDMHGGPLAAPQITGS